MNNKTPTIGNKKHINCCFVRGITYYLEQTYGLQKTIEILDKINLSYSRINDQNHWIHWDEYENLIQEVVNYSADPDVMQKIAKFTLQKNTLGSLWFVVFSNVISVKFTFKKIIDHMNLYNRSSTWEILELTNNKLSLKINWHPDIKVTKLSCRHRQAILSYAPKLWNNEAAIVRERQCQSDNNESCIEEYYWHNKPTYLFSIALPLISLTATYAMNYLTTEPVNATLGILLSLLFGFIIDERRIKKIERKFSTDQTKTLLDSMTQVENKYDELQKTHNELNATYDELLEAKKLDQIRVIASSTAHDYNNILTGIMGHLDLAILSLEKNENREKVIDILKEIDRASIQANKLTNQLLSLTKDNPQSVEQPIAVEEMIKNDIEFSLRGSNVKSQFQFDKNLNPINIDKTQFNQIILNLTLNAAQAMPKGGCIYVSVRNTSINNNSKKREHSQVRNGNYLLMTIRDEGLGISQEDIDKIFDLHFTTKKEGHGIGLASVYRIITKNNGYIFVKSAPSKGTEFQVYLPAYHTTEKIKRPIFGKGKILALDNDPIIRNMLTKISTYLGYSIITTKNGSDTISAYKKAAEQAQGFDVVIVDLSIPGDIGGTEVLKALLDIDPNVKAIISSGCDKAPAIDQYDQFGFVAAIRKPYNLTELSEILYDTVTM